MWRVRIGVLFTALLLSGCLGEPSTSGDVRLLNQTEIEARLSQPVFKDLLREEVTVDGANSTTLWLTIHRPREAPGPVPAILVMTPYGVLIDANPDCMDVPRDTCPADAEIIDYFVPRGYAVVFGDVRGHRNSNGCSDLAGPETWQDGFAVVEWLANQPWSNGRVGMYGASFDAQVAAGTATLTPPHLATILVEAMPSSFYEDFYYDGVSYGSSPAVGVAAYSALGVWPGSHFDPSQYPERFGCQPEQMLESETGGDWSEYWETHDLRPLAPRIQASVLQTHGFLDTNVRVDQLDGFWNEIQSEKRLVVGRWGHEAAAREDWLLTRHRWFDHYLKDIDTGLLQDLPPVLIQDTAGAWRGIDSFPPRNATELKLYLTAEGKLVREPPAEGTLALRDYPRGGSEGPFGKLLSTPGETLTGTPRLLVFESDVLDADLHYTGRPYVRLAASTDAKSTHWVGRLVDADPEPETSTAPDEEDISDRGFLNTRHRVSVKEPKDLTPGEVYEATVRMFPADDVIEAGHRLRIVLNNNDPWVLQDTTFATSTVHFGPEGTYVVIPLAPQGIPIPADTLRAS